MCVCARAHKGLSQDSYNASTFNEPWLVSAKSCFALGLYVGDTSAGDNLSTLLLFKEERWG